MRALVGLGGNLGRGDEIVARFAAAVDALRERLPVVQVRGSGLYTSAPVGPDMGPDMGQPPFVNAALELELEPAIAPVSLMAELLRVERAFGRVRHASAPRGPRTLDLDLLFVDRQVLESDGPPALSLPHPRVAERAFVLRPLADLMGRGWRMPGIERSIDECLGQAHVASQAIEPMRASGPSWVERGRG